MSRLSRATQNLFASTATSGQIAQFGSLQAGSPVTYSGSTVTASLVQSLAAFASGWYSAIIGAGAPTIQDMNALFWLSFYQLSYLFQLGVPEWDSGTTYYAGSIAQDGNGFMYVSTVNSNTGNALTNTAYWLPQSNKSRITSVGAGTTYGFSLTDNKSIFNLSTSGAAITMNLPNPSTAGRGWSVTLKNSDGSFGAGFNAFLVPYGSETIEGLASTYTMMAPWGSWTIYTDGTNWWFV